MIWAKFSYVRVGTKLRADSGFDCIEPDTILTVANNDGLYVPCSCGMHFLFGQPDDDGFLIGFSEVQP